MKNIKVETVNKITKNMKVLTSNLKFEMSESHVSPFIIKKNQKNTEKTIESPKESFLESKNNKL